MKGRKHKPDAIKKLSGTLQKCRTVITNTEGVLSTLPEFPDKYGREAKEIYESDAPYLLAMGLLTMMNYKLFTAYCRKLVKHEHLMDLIDECTDLDERIKLERLAKELFNQIMAIARDFAIPPVYWNKIAPKKEDNRTEFQKKFLSGKP